MKFGSSKIASKSTVKGAFKPWSIVEVIKVSAKAEMKSIKDEDKFLLNVKFEDDINAYEHTFWPLTEADEKRVDRGYGENPSEYEQFICKVMHIIAHVNPKAYSEINNGTHPLATDDNDWSTTAGLIADIINEGKARKANLKLEGYSGKPQLAKWPLNMNKQGEAYMTSNFFGGPEVVWTPKEAVKRDDALAENNATSDPLAGMGNMPAGLADIPVASGIDVYDGEEYDDSGADTTPTTDANGLPF